MWQVINGPKLSCYRITLRVARGRLKSNPELPPLVRFLGTKKPWPNNDVMNLDWYLRPDPVTGSVVPGVFDYSCDPTWVHNPNPNP